MHIDKSFRQRQWETLRSGLRTSPSHWILDW